MTDDNELVKRRDGKYEERFDENWMAEYSENPATGLWEVELFRHDVAEWHELDLDSLDDARAAAADFFKQAG